MNNNPTYKDLVEYLNDMRKRGFADGFIRFCHERNLNPACVGSVARYNVHLRGK
jgi:hypothetical protein